MAKAMKLRPDMTEFSAAFGRVRDALSELVTSKIAVVDERGHVVSTFPGVTSLTFEVNGQQVVLQTESDS